MPLIIILFFSLLNMVCSNQQQKTNFQPPVSSTIHPSRISIVELFTSQGCSSCPRADALMKELDGSYNDKSVIFLAWHVDYWDRLGWKDVFSRPAWSERQRRFASAFGSGRVYTPQSVVNATDECVGSASVQLNSLILKGRKTSEITALKIKKEGDELRFDSIPMHGKKLSILLVQRDSTVQIKKGENEGRTFNYHNIVLNEFVTEPNGVISYVLLPESLRKIPASQYLVLLVSDLNTMKYYAAGSVH